MYTVLIFATGVRRQNKMASFILTQCAYAIAINLICVLNVNLKVFTVLLHY